MSRSRIDSRSGVAPLQLAGELVALAHRRMTVNPRFGNRTLVVASAEQYQQGRLEVWLPADRPLMHCRTQSPYGSR